MAIFTSVANHLKCRNYFESVLGFRLVEKYPDESVADFNEDVEGFVITQVIQQRHLYPMWMVMVYFADVQIV